MLSSLDNLLPRQLANPTVHETERHRIVSAENGAARVLLIVANNQAPVPEPRDELFDRLSNQQGKLVDLVRGEESHMSYRTFSTRTAGEDRPQSPMLLALNSE